jgi:hypothetical protein
MAAQTPVSAIPVPDGVRTDAKASCSWVKGNLTFASLSTLLTFGGVVANAVLEVGAYCAGPVFR